jgi:hypothetical protein
MNTQLPARFANRPKRNVAEQTVEGLGSAAPPYVSIAGGSFTLIDGNGEREPIAGKHLDAVIIDTNALSRVYWGKDAKYDPSADSYQAPLCFSDNGIGASRNAQQPQSANCQTCPQNVWGSAVSKLTGKPVKACSAMKKVALLVDGWDFPFLLRVPVMSHDNLRAYGDKFKGQEFDVSDVTTRITFVHGHTGQLDFNALGFTDDEIEALVQKVLAAKMTDSLVGRGDVPVQGVLPAPQEARPLPPPAQSAPFPSTPTATAQTESALPATAASSSKRGRKPKAEPAAPAGGPFGGAPAEPGVPPFLQRAATPAPQHGIQTNAPSPTAEMDAALQSVFGLNTK